MELHIVSKCMLEQIQLNTNILHSIIEQQNERLIRFAYEKHKILINRCVYNFLPCYYSCHFLMLFPYSQNRQKLEYKIYYLFPPGQKNCMIKFGNYLQHVYNILLLQFCITFYIIIFIPFIRKHFFTKTLLHFSTKMDFFSILPYLFAPGQKNCMIRF